MKIAVKNAERLVKEIPATNGDPLTRVHQLVQYLANLKEPRVKGRHCVTKRHSSPLNLLKTWREQIADTKPQSNARTLPSVQTLDSHAQLRICIVCHSDDSKIVITSRRVILAENNGPLVQTLGALDAMPAHTNLPSNSHYGKSRGASCKMVT